MTSCFRTFKKCAFAKILGRLDELSPTEHRGNPVKSTQVNRYLAFTTAEQQTQCVPVGQAPPILRPNLQTLVRSMRTRLAASDSVHKRMGL